MPPTPMLIEASLGNPVTVYYCKAGIQTGKTIRVLHAGIVHQTSSVAIHNANATMSHDNSKGKPKASGARCVLTMTHGKISFNL
jgi:hypothetical protein